ncbi:MAG TPA: response regulator [Cytophagales bacterium]|nr:response regulator [Cytophagales bacterium]
MSIKKAYLNEDEYANSMWQLKNKFIQMKNVLMFYDDAILIDLVRISLEDKGIDVFGFSNTKNIINQVKQYDPLAVILDLNIAVEIGKETINSLKAFNIPTVIFSSDLNGRKNAEKAGIDFFVKKSSYGFEELEKVIEKILEKEKMAV